jgi:hypothetical protein
MKKDINANPSTNDCFVIMPIADPEGYEKGHFRKVYEDIFQIACDKAGFKAVRADEVKQTNLIHLDILQKLIDSSMSICDLSNRNPNVLFELGLRQAFDKPTVLVQETDTPPIFDISPLRYTNYNKELKYRDVLDAQTNIAAALKATKEATSKGEGVNSIVGLLSLASPALLKDITENDAAKMLQIVMSEMNDLRTDFRRTINKIDDRSPRVFHDQSESMMVIFEKFKMAIFNKSSLEVVKDLYDNFQFKLMRYYELNPHKELPKKVIDARNEAELLLAHYYAKD